MQWWFRKPDICITAVCFIYVVPMLNQLYWCETSLFAVHLSCWKARCKYEEEKKGIRNKLLLTSFLMWQYCYLHGKDMEAPH